ncbi:hypothetical protein KIPB_007795 [Kipferlia bialata]|uniref:Hint domain-containing protein n=1 Tax=Kipferlia bialata TaxID=797122 RepID=A0A9K3GKT3_9EUKA|nr:hypothetical protein KIPB_007795 [Kipferlia bialata]|eukprot:g7795.t1
MPCCKGCHAAGTLIWTAKKGREGTSSGGAPGLRWHACLVPVEDIVAGDLILCPPGAGEAERGVAARPVMRVVEGRSQLHTVNPRTGAPFEVTPHHLLTVVDTGTPHPHRYTSGGAGRGGGAPSFLTRSGVFASGGVGDSSPLDTPQAQARGAAYSPPPPPPLRDVAAWTLVKRRGTRDQPLCLYRCPIPPAGPQPPLPVSPFLLPCLVLPDTFSCIQRLRSAYDTPLMRSADAGYALPLYGDLSACDPDGLVLTHLMDRVARGDMAMLLSATSLAIGDRAVVLCGLLALVTSILQGSSDPSLCLVVSLSVSVKHCVARFVLDSLVTLGWLPYQVALDAGQGVWTEPVDIVAEPFPTGLSATHPSFLSLEVTVGEAARYVPFSVEAGDVAPYHGITLGRHGPKGSGSTHHRVDGGEDPIEGASTDSSDPSPSPSPAMPLELALPASVADPILPLPSHLQRYLMGDGTVTHNSPHV